MTGQLPDVMRAAIVAYMQGVHTAMPVEVQAYYSSKKQVDVHPLIKIAFQGKDEITCPVISSVPIMYPGSSDAVIQFPLKKGDSGLLICSERSMENWLASSGGEASPGDPRRFSLTDSVFLPGLFPFASPGKVGQNSAGLEIVYKGYEIQIDDNGNVNFGGNTDHLVTWEALNTALSSFLTALTTAMTTTLIAGNGATQPAWTGMPTSINISGAKATHLKTGD